MTVCDYEWLYITMYDYVWYQMEVCLCMTMYDYVWICMAMYGYVWLYMTMYYKNDCVWLCITRMTVYDYVLQSMTLNC